MTVDQKIFYHRVLSNLLMEMARHGESKHEVLTLVDKLETETEWLLTMCVQGQFTNKLQEKITLSNEDRAQHRIKIATCLERISRPNTRPEDVLEMIKGMDEWIDQITERHMRALIGKPKFQVTRKPSA